MKKILALAIFLIVSFDIIGQNIYNLVDKAPANTDGIFKSSPIFNNFAWCIQVEIINPGALDGTVSVIESSNDTAYTQYSSSMKKTVSAMPYTINGAHDTIRVARFADFYFDGKFIALKYTAGHGLHSGTVRAILTLKSTR